MTAIFSWVISVRQTYRRGGDGHLTIDRQELATGEWVNRDDIPDYPEHLSLTHEMMVYFKEHGQEVFK